MDQIPNEPTYPFQDLIGFELVEWATGTATLQLKLTPEHLNRHATPHGGLYATLLDTAMGYAGCFTTGEQQLHTMTLSLNVNYLSRPKGEILSAKGWHTGGGKRTFFAQGEVTDETGELIATASAAFRYRSQMT